MDHLKYISSSRIRTSADEVSQQEQQGAIAALKEALGPVRTALTRLQIADEECRSANIEENDHTIFTYDDLEFELQLVESAVTKKFKFIDNQVRLDPAFSLIVVSHSGRLSHETQRT
jgi:hypothetical protein